jgi:hypothetical protein
MTVPGGPEDKLIETETSLAGRTPVPPQTRKRSPWRMRIVVIGLTVGLLLVGLAGRMESPILNYEGTIKYEPGSSSFIGQAKLSSVTVDEALYPVGNQTVSFDPIEDVVQTLIVNMAAPTSIVLSNSTATENATTTGFNEVYPSGLHYVTATDAYRNMSVGPKIGASNSIFSLNVTMQQTAGPALAVADPQGVVTPAIPTSVWLYPADASSKVAISLDNPNLQIRNGPPLSMNGSALLSVPSFSVAFVGFLTRSHSFPFYVGDNITWSGGSLSFGNVNGVLIPSQGNQKPLASASLTTLLPPWRSTVTFAYDRASQVNEIKIELETTTVQITDANGTVLVGQVSADQPLWNLDPYVKDVLLAVLTVGVGLATFLSSGDDRQHGR